MLNNSLSPEHDNDIIPIAEIFSANKKRMDEHTLTKRKYSGACLCCNRSHVHCDGERPCGRCNARGLDCVEPEKKKRGPKFKSDKKIPSEALTSTQQRIDYSISLPMNLGYAEINYYGLNEHDLMDYQEIQLPISHSTEKDTVNNEKRILPYVQYEQHPSILKNLINWGFKVHVEELTKIIQEYKRVVQFLNQEQILKLSLDYERLLQDVTKASNELEFPVIVFVEFGVGIHHVNQALREFTGWAGIVPSPAKNGAFMGLFDLKTLHKFNDLFPKMMLGPSKIRASLDGSMITPNGNFEEGRILITIKRDIFGLPQIFLMQFAPFKSSDDE